MTDVTARLEKEAHRIASVMYQNAGGAPGAGPNGGPGGPDGGGAPGGGGSGAAGGEKKKDGGVIDAEFEETGG